MLFNSIHFLLFFPIVSALFFALPHRLRWAFLLLASCYFYAAFIPAYILILVFTILIDYAAGLAIEGARGRRRKLYLATSLVANVGILAIFKYYNFFVDNVGAVLSALHLGAGPSRMGWILPIGLSFHTFQAMSYTIEVYRGNERAERHLGIYALYVLFYPQLVAGPIERPQNLLGQFHARQSFDAARVTSGLRLMLWGLFKKVAIADRLGCFVDPVYSNLGQYHGLTLILATYLFAFQIYCDFSGYSDIALGCARVLGVRLMKNFDHPYSAGSISEFWRRWHISLSTWFRDYVYVPLGGNRVPPLTRARNLLLVFLLSGLWHGANWTFVIWGALHGTFLVAAILTAPLRERLGETLGLSQTVQGGPARWLWRALQILLTFHLVCLSWIFFRAASVSDAFYVLRHLGEGLGQGLQATGVSGRNLVVSGLLVSALLVVDTLLLRRSLDELLDRCPAWLRWAAYYGAVLVLLMFGEFGSHQFIYFQF